MTRIAIIGAGFSGLSLATLLKDKADITVFEKARGIGGRLSTRRGEPYAFDHGAQYFTAREEAFQEFLRPLLMKGLVRRWDAKYARYDSNRKISFTDWKLDEPRYVGTPGMNSPLKELAKQHHVRLNCRVTKIERDSDWQLFDQEGNNLGQFDWVISTAPTPQTGALFPDTFQYISEICHAEMYPCFALMLGFEEALGWDFDAAHIDNSDLSWLAINSSKPQRPSKQTLVAHSSIGFAAEYAERRHEEVIRKLCLEIERVTGCYVGHSQHTALHFWRYANSDRSIQYDSLIDQNLRLAACGDWCNGGRVEGAFMSAHRLAEHLESLIQ
ncbi:NAD(P)/FAD-dependent oxidoreductase [Pseudoteredinibacter isoporae]|uniref:Amine oxidase domain-containing protein n=1 Tax=Pseudoteredinibacter isoporae TaxID=570281 RepID=A0A7X0MUG7_9GAMM|nr:FAD-dependent oxidoreductase [Pseudoteredinibacter isoporae]MBB6520005.1 hypothetical protein [Pseudoteredinibacter isoporae]NHO85577.1 NAD(P)-binding protein [Pseudoteredinibacter isoporae]NIB25971.1 NAD(P)-binding protein [Pseudoteredinibacter isoporae]